MTDYRTDPMPQPMPLQMPQPTPWPVPGPRSALPISGPLPQLTAPLPPTPPPWPLTQEPRKPRSSTALIVVTVVLFVAAALAGTLYITADRDRDAAVALSADRQTDLATAKEQVASTEEGASLAEGDNTALTDENTTLRTCVEAVQAYLWDDLAEQERLDAADRMWTACQWAGVREQHGGAPRCAMWSASCLARTASRSSSAVVAWARSTAPTTPPTTGTSR